MHQPSPNPNLPPDSLPMATRPVGSSSRLGLLFALSCATGCVEEWKGTDADGDGYGVIEGDCWDQVEGPPGSGLSGADIHPGAVDQWYDGFDADCGGEDDYDPDGDGWVKEEAHKGMTTLGVVDSGRGHVGVGDCLNTPEDLESFLAAHVFAPTATAPDTVDFATVFAGATDDWYDGIDTNCDLLDDHDADLDGDRKIGFGDDGYTDTDCDDDDPQRAGIFDEVCDPESIDEDCDDLVNGDDDSVDPDSVFDVFDDADGDSFGDPTTADSACDLPDDKVADGTDCNDADPDINPAATEVCDDDDTDENCDGNADDDDPAVAYAASDVAWSDSDGDGYGDPEARVEVCDPDGTLVTNDQDCDDTDIAVNPAATEVCDGGIDNDCANGADDADPAVDLSTGTEWYRDADSDGYGDLATTTRTCVVPSGYTSDATDCDDTDGAVNPGATEVCNGIDDDCDATSDDADSSVVYGAGDVWYADTDADSFGNAGSTTQACDQPASHVRDDTDCDDTDSAINPSADEVCDAGDVDEDCNGLADDDDGDVTGPFTTYYADTDTDGYGDATASLEACDLPTGYVTDSDDCDDGDSAINPGADEICDAGDVDEDCNGLADDDDGDVIGTFTTFYADTDSDGYGDAASPIDACDQPAGHVTNDSDCLDSDATVSPVGTEVCNGLDDDCDGDTDDDDASVDASTFETFYFDGDSDDYGLDAVTTQACAAPSGYAADSGDCDDTEGTTYPGAPETCNDGVDADCEPTTCLLETESLEGGADVIWRGEDAGDTLGFRVAMVPDITGDGVPDVLASAYLDDPTVAASTITSGGSVRIGASLDEAELDADVDTDMDVATLIKGSSNADRLGEAITVGDYDNDGNNDLVVGAILANVPASDRGATYLLYGPITSASVVAGGGTDASTGGTTKDIYFGWAAASGDANGDVYDDLAVGAPDCGDASTGTSTSTGTGAVFMMLGDTGTSWHDSGLASTTGLELTGAGSGDCSGFALVFADIDGSGTDELVVGAPKAGTGGEVYFADASQTGTSALADEPMVDGWATAHQTGYSLDAGDIDGDGYDDVLIGAIGVSSNEGAVYLIPGSASGIGSVSSPPTAASQATATINPPSSSSSQLGSSVAIAGDLDDDGATDFVLGAWLDNVATTKAGAAWIVHGPISGTVTLDDATDAALTGASINERAGISVAGGEDINGDGFDDVVVGGYAARNASSSQTGATYMVFGRGN